MFKTEEILMSFEDRLISRCGNMYIIIMMKYEALSFDQWVFVSVKL